MLLLRSIVFVGLFDFGSDCCFGYWLVSQKAVRVCAFSCVFGVEAFGVLERGCG